MSENKVSVIIESLKADILDGKYAPGSAFPSVKMICRMFNVSHLTAVKAIESLKQLGLVKSRNGVGTFVRRRMKSIGLIIVSMIGNIEILPPIAREISRLALTSGIGLDFADMSTDFSENDDALVVDAAVVILDSDIEAAPCEDRFDFVGVDNFEIGQFAGRHVIERGARKVAFVTWSVMNSNVRRRLDGLVSAIAQKRGAKLAGQYVWQGDEAIMSRRWKGSFPDAIVCTSDLVAAHVLNLLRKIGKRCPQDVLVTGVNDVDIAGLVSPALTTVHQPCKDIARTAFETLLWRFDNPDAEKRRIMLAAELVVRESTTR